MKFSWKNQPIVSGSATKKRPESDHFETLCRRQSALPGLSVLLPHLRAGGIEKSTIRLLNALHGNRLSARLILGRAEGDLLAELREDVPVVDLGGARASASIRTLARLLSRDTDVVYSGTNARNIALLLALRLIPRARRPVAAISEHTSPQDYMQAARMPALRRALMRRLYPTAQALIAPAEGLGQDWLDMLRLEAPRAIALPNPILDAADLALADRVAAGQGPARDPDLALTVGRLHPAKGHDIAIRALAHARRTRPGLRLRILGEGAERPALERIAADLGVAEAVSLPGFVRDVGAEMAGAGLLVVPSRREGFGNVVVEALSLGTPVLATDCDGPRALLAEAPGAGRIVPRADPEAMGEAMAQMTGAPDLAAAAAGPGRSLARRYGVDAAAAAFADTIDGLLAGAGRPAPALRSAAGPPKR